MYPILERCFRADKRTTYERRNVREPGEGEGEVK